MAVVIGTTALVLAGCGGGGDDSAVVEETSAAPEAAPGSRAVLQDAEGAEVGSVSFSEVAAGTEVVAEVQGLEPGTTGAFLSAGGHLGNEDAEHPGHRGDLPGLLVTEEGAGFLTTVTDRFGVQDLVADDDGSAVMVHSGPDNHANVPERYAPGGPDEATLGTGDAGSRLACGVVE